MQFNISVHEVYHLGSYLSYIEDHMPLRAIRPDLVYVSRILCTDQAECSNALHIT